MSDSKIFGHTWEQIKAKQQGTDISKPLPTVSAETQRNRIMADMEKFGIPVDAQVAVNLEITIPAHYTLGADHVWRVVA